MFSRRLLVPLLVGLALVVVLAAAVAVSARSGGPETARAAAEEPAAETGVRVEGVGTASATPDVLRVTIGVEASEPTVQEALSGSNAAARRVLDELEARGVAARDVQSANLQLHPRFGREGEEITGYVARQELTVTLRDLDDAGETIGAAVEAAGDAARLQGMSFAIEDDAELQAQAREAAFADARRAAEQYAELAGRGLGEVLEISERIASSGPVPFAAEALAADAAAVPIAPGRSEVTVTVSVRWALT